MIINSEIFSNTIGFLVNNRISSYLEDALFINHCVTFEDARYLASNTLLTIDNMLTGPSKKQYLGFEDLKNDLSKLKKSVNEKAGLLDEFQLNDNLHCKQIVDSNEFKEIQTSLRDFSNEVIMYQADHYYDIYNY